MTISAVWRSGDYAYMCSDTAESGRADTAFPVSSFDEEASASELNAQERALKLVQVGTHGIATASGDGTVARLIMDQLDALTTDELGHGVEAALALAANRAGLNDAVVCTATWLCAEWRDGALSTFRWPHAASGAKEPPCRDAAALLAGNLTKDLADGFCHVGGHTLAGLRAQRDAGASLPKTAELSMIAATFQAIILSEGLCAARGIGGAVVAARVGPEGVLWIPDTLYVISNPDLVRRVAIGSGGRAELADLASFVVCLAVREGCLFLGSTCRDSARVLVPGEEKRAEGRWRARWEGEILAPSFWSRSQCVVFLNPVQRAITTFIGDFTKMNRLLRLTVDPATDTLAGEFYPGIQEHLADVGRPGEPWRARFDAVPPFNVPGPEPT
ncbi:MAG: hypothetical protein R3F61_26995 [Myxococcota bacterium]